MYCKIFIGEKPGADGIETYHAEIKDVSDITTGYNAAKKQLNKCRKKNPKVNILMTAVVNG